MLIFILKYGRTGVVELLLKIPGIDINAKEEDGHTPLNIAAYVSYNHNDTYLVYLYIINQLFHVNICIAGWIH